MKKTTTMKKEIIMLPSSQEEKIGDFLISKIDHNILSCGVKKNNLNTLKGTRQHLYIISKEKCIKGDWCFGYWKRKIFKCRINNYQDQYDYPFGLYKILFSTDETLLSDGETKIHNIPEDFVNKYVGFVNKDMPIKYVFIENGNIYPFRETYNREEVKAALESSLNDNDFLKKQFVEDFLNKIDRQ